MDENTTLPPPAPSDPAPQAPIPTVTAPTPATAVPATEVLAKPVPPVTERVQQPTLARMIGPMFAMVFAALILHVVITGRYDHAMGTFGGMAGMLLFPPLRHRARETYRGTVWTVKLALFLVFTAVLGQFVGGFLVGFIAAMKGRGAHGPLMSPEALFAITWATVATAMLAAWINRLRGHEWWAMGLQRQTSFNSLWIGIQAGLVLGALRLISFKLVHTAGIWQLGDGANPVAVFFSVRDPVRGVIGLVMGAILVPISEEVLFRGVLFAALRRRSGPVSAALVSAIIFGFCHYPDIGFPLLLGIVLALLYHRTGSLWAPIGAHIMVNATTLGLAYDHARLTAYLTWTHVGAVIVLVGMLQIVAACLESSSPAERCLCGRSDTTLTRRCAECCYPTAIWPRWIGVCLRLMSAGGLVMLASFSLFLNWALHLPYGASRSPTLLRMQYNALEIGHPDEARTLFEDWKRDKPNDPGVLALDQHIAYASEDYAQIIRLIEEHTPDTEEYSQADKNELCLCYAELGGPDAVVGVAFGREAVKGLSGPRRASVEDSLGWALVRAGDLEAATPLLDRDIGDYGFEARSGVAELDYHRGVLLWAKGEVERAKPLLAESAEMGDAGRPFSVRSRKILDAGALPAGLVPAKRLPGLANPAKPGDLPRHRSRKP